VELIKPSRPISGKIDARNLPRDYFFISGKSVTIPEQTFQSLLVSMGSEFRAGKNTEASCQLV